MDFLECVKSAGVVGAGGAGFPTHIKLASKAEYLIINAAECEPLIEVDKYLCRTFADDIVRAVAATASHLGASKSVFAIKAEYQTEIEALKAAVKKSGSDSISFCEMPSFYPAGDEQTMVQLVTGRSIPERGLPLDVGAVVQNVGTMLNIAHALDGTPVEDKFLSITGAVVKPVVLCVPIGTSVRDCIAQAELQGTVRKNPAVLLGGPMMGRILTGPEEIDAAVVTKTTGNIALLPMDHYLVRRSQLSIDRMRHQARSACIQCRMCTDMCPRYLIGHEIRPHLVMRNIWRENSLANDNDEYVREFGDALNCCDCGVCEMFACPMGLSPRKMNGYFKQKFREKGLNKERNMSPEASRFVDERRVPTGRLYSRLGLGGWHGVHVREPHRSFVPKEVYIPFRQHIGKPALPVVEAGQTVERGTLVAAAQEGVSANIYTGLAGRVASVDANGARIIAESITESTREGADGRE